MAITEMENTYKKSSGTNERILVVFDIEQEANAARS
jgi:hypothetical protein